MRWEILIKEHTWKQAKEGVLQTLTIYMPPNMDETTTLLRGSSNLKPDEFTESPG